MKDVVAANVIALQKGDLDAFNIGTNKETATEDLYREIAKQMGKNIEPIRAAARAGDIRRSCLDFAKAERNLGWRPQFSLAAGIGETIKFFVD